MRIVIDMQGAQSDSRFRGIGRYSLEFAKSIALNRGNHDVYLVLNGRLNESIQPIRAAFKGILPREFIKVWYSAGPVRSCDVRNGPRRLISEKIRDAFIESLDPDVIHLTSLFEGYIDDATTGVKRRHDGRITTVTFYDLIPFVNSKYYLESNPSYANFYAQKIEQLKEADALLAISAFSRNEAIRLLGLPDESVITVSTGISPLTSNVEEALQESIKAWSNNLGINRSFLLYSGGSDERKNLVRLVEAFSKLPEPTRAQNLLVLAGKIRDQDKYLLRATAKAAKLEEKSLIFTGYISDYQLSYLYKTCSLYVFPSWHEGFGLPPLEAMQHGAPVIASNATSIPEVVGLECALFDPYNTDEIAAKLLEALTDEGFRNKLRTHGATQASSFTWQKVALNALATWTSLHRRGISLQRDIYHSLTQNQINIIDTLGPLLEQIIPAAKHLNEEDLVQTSFSIDLIANTRQPRQLLIDVSELVTRDAGTGVQRVTRNILKQLLEKSPDGYVIRPVYATLDSFGYRYTKKFGFNDLSGESVEDNAPIRYQSGDIFLGLDLQHHTTRVHARFLHCLRDFGVDVRFVIYDLLPIQFPEFWPPEHRVSEVHEEWLSVVSEYDGVICISKSVAVEFKDWIVKRDPLRLNSLKIGWFHLGGDIEGFKSRTEPPPHLDETLFRIKQSPSFLMVGTLEPRKGHTQALDAFETLWSQNLSINLVIVGKKGWLTDELAERIRDHPLFNKNLFWLESISDNILDSIYSTSSCLLAASYGEGFGLPLIEAAHHQIPIIARDIPVFREVAGSHAYYFASHSPEELASCIMVWLDMYRNNEHPTSKDLRWISWRESAKQLVAELIDGC